MQDLELRHGALPALEIALRVAILDAVHLAVVVPYGLGAHLQDVLLQQLLPGLARSGLGEVDEAAFTAPPAAKVIGAAVRGLDEHVVLLEQVHVRMALEDARLQVRDDVDAAAVHLLEERLRIREALVVPVEHIA